jgi:hypothetical protein
MFQYVFRRGRFYACQLLGDHKSRPYIKTSEKSRPDVIPANLLGENPAVNALSKR